MSQTLVPGQNCPLPAGVLDIVATAGAPADFSAFRLYDNDRIRRDEDFIFYGQTVTPDMSVRLVTDTSSAAFRITPDLLPCEKVIICVTSDFPAIASLKTLGLEIWQNGSDLLACRLDAENRSEGSLILGELYKRNGVWKFRCICQGFKGGLRTLAEKFGVEICDDNTPAGAVPPATNQPAPQPESSQPESSQPGPGVKVNLGKVVLTKSMPAVNLGKQELRGGTYKVNLNWNAGVRAQKRGLSRIFARDNGIDLDLGAYVRLKNGEQTIVQALGKRFGSLEQFPFVKLLGDDRTGDTAEGEWIYINGDKIEEIAEVIIFAFIYSGVPNWNATDGVVRLSIPGQPEIETRLAGRDNAMTMCAIARLENSGGTLRVERLDRYFAGHMEMDEAFNWGFRWRAGRK